MQFTMFYRTSSNILILIFLRLVCDKRWNGWSEAERRRSADRSNRMDARWEEIKFCNLCFQFIPCLPPSVWLFLLYSLFYTSHFNYYFLFSSSLFFYLRTIFVRTWNVPFSVYIDMCVSVYFYFSHIIPFPSLSLSLSLFLSLFLSLSLFILFLFAHFFSSFSTVLTVVQNGVLAEFEARFDRLLGAFTCRIEYYHHLKYNKRGAFTCRVEYYHHLKYNKI